MDLKWSCKLKKGGYLTCEAKLPSSFEASNYMTSNADMNSLDNFMDRFQNEDTPHFICVFASWCGHCQRLKEVCGPAWNKVKAQRGAKNVLIIDGDQERNLVRDLGLENIVQGYPTVLANFNKNGFNGKFNHLNQNRDQVFSQAVNEAAK